MLQGKSVTRLDICTLIYLSVSHNHFAHETYKSKSHFAIASANQIKLLLTTVFEDKCENVVASKV